MSSEALIPWFAWLAPRLLLLFGLGFLVANIKLVARARCAITAASGRRCWSGRHPSRATTASASRSAWFSVCSSSFKVFAQAAVVLAVRRGDDVRLLRLSRFRLSTRIARGFYQDGVWSDSGFMPWWQISAVSWKDEGAGDAHPHLARHTAWRAVWRCRATCTARPAGCCWTDQGPRHPDRRRRARPRHPGRGATADSKCTRACH